MRGGRSLGGSSHVQHVFVYGRSREPVITPCAQTHIFRLHFCDTDIVRECENREPRSTRDKQAAPAPQFRVFFMRLPLSF
jgi:hypothetical protein